MASLTYVKGKCTEGTWLSKCVLPPLNTGKTTDHTTVGNGRQNLLDTAEKVSGMKLTYTLHAQQCIYSLCDWAQAALGPGAAETATVRFAERQEKPVIANNSSQSRFLTGYPHAPPPLCTLWAIYNVSCSSTFCDIHPKNKTVGNKRPPQASQLCV